MEITDELVEQFEEVRESGEVNMFDRFSVARVAMDRGLYALAAIAGEFGSGGYVELLRSIRR